MNEKVLKNNSYNSALLPRFSAYFKYARHGLFEILRLCKIGKNDKVLIPDFICLEVLGSIRAIGAEPIFYSVSENLIANNLPSDPHIKAILVVNYFGFAQSLELYEEYCKKNNTILIEDNAHGFLSRDKFGKWLGTRSDFGIFSLRKTFFSVNGGALWLKKPYLYSDLSIMQPLSSPIPLKIKTKILLRNIQLKTSIPVSYFFDLFYWFFRYIRTGYYFPLPNFQNEYLMTPIAPIHIHILQKINNFDVLSELKRRIYLFYKVNIILSDFKIFPLYSELPEGTIPYGYAFRTTPDELKKIIPKIAVFGLYPVKWPELPSKVYLTAPEYYKNVYLINFI